MYIKTCRALRYQDVCFQEQWALGLISVLLRAFFGEIYRETEQLH